MANIGDLSIAIKAVDDASKVFKDVERNIESLSNVSTSSTVGLTKSWGNVVNSFSSVGDAFSTFAGHFSTEIGLIKKGAKYTAIGIAGLAAGVGYFGTKLGFSAARTKELGYALDAIAKAAGLSSDEVYKSVDVLRDANIQHKLALGITAKFIQANLDLADSERLATAAKNLAVIAGRDSSETLGLMTDAIIRTDAQMLEQINLTVSAEEVYGKYAKKMGMANTSAGVLQRTLTTYQKQQAYINWLVEAGTSATGAYDAAMGSVSKRFRSLVGRILPDMEERLGVLFEPILTVAVDDYTDAIERLSDWAKKNKVNLYAMGKVIAGYLKEAVDKVKGKFLEWYDSMGGIEGIMNSLVGVIAKVVGVIVNVATAVYEAGKYIKDHAKLIITLILLYEALKLTFATVEFGVNLTDAFIKIKDAVIGLAAALGTTVGIMSVVIVVVAAMAYGAWKLQEAISEWGKEHKTLRRIIMTCLGPITALVDVVYNWKEYVAEFGPILDTLKGGWKTVGRVALWLIGPFGMIIDVLIHTIAYLRETGNWWEALKESFRHPITAVINIVRRMFGGEGEPTEAVTEGDKESETKSFLDTLRGGFSILDGFNEKVQENIDKILAQGDSFGYPADEAKKLARATAAASSANEENAKSVKKIADEYEKIEKQMKSYKKSRKGLKEDYKESLRDMKEDFLETMVGLDKDFTKEMADIRRKFNDDMLGLKKDLDKSLKDLDETYKKNEEKSEAEHKDSVAGIIINKEDKLANLKKEFANEENVERKAELDEQIKIIENFLEKHKSDYITYANEIKAIRNFNALDDIEKLVFKHNQEKIERARNYAEEKAERIVKYNEQVAERQIQFEEEKAKRIAQYNEKKVMELKQYKEDRKDRKEKFKDDMKDLKEEHKEKLKELKKHLKDVKRELKSFIGSKTVRKSRSISSGGLEGIDFDPEGKPLRRALGGFVGAGMSAIVGEKGPELIVPAKNSLVVPNNVFKQLGKDTGDVINNTSQLNLTVNVGTYAGSYTEKRKLGEEIFEAYNQTREAKGLAPL